MTEKRNNKDVDSTTEFKKLSIQISLNGLSFCVVDTLDNTVIESKSVRFKIALNPIQLQKELKQLLETNKIHTATFSEVLVIHRNNLYCLVPKSLFKEENIRDYLKYNAKILTGDLIVFDEIDNFDMVNVYVPLVNINNYVYELFGEFTYKHSATIIVPSLLNNKSKDTVCYVHTDGNQMDITLTNNKKLLLFNSFDYSSTDDFMYYLLFTLEQLELDNEIVKLRLFGEVEEESELYKECHKHIKNVSIYVPDNNNFHFTDNTKDSIDFTVLSSL